MPNEQLLKFPMFGHKEKGLSYYTWREWKASKGDEARFIHKMYFRSDKFSNAHTILGNRLDDIVTGLRVPETPQEKNILEQSKGVLKKFRATRLERVLASQVPAFLNDKKVLFYCSSKPDFRSADNKIIGDWKTLYLNEDNAERKNQQKVKAKINATRKQLQFYSLQAYLAHNEKPITEKLVMALVVTTGDPKKGKLHYKTGNILLYDIPLLTHEEVLAMSTLLKEELPKMYSVLKRAHDFKKELSQTRSSFDASKIPF